MEKPKSSKRQKTQKLPEEKLTEEIPVTTPPVSHQLFQWNISLSDCPSRKILHVEMTQLESSTTKLTMSMHGPIDKHMYGSLVENFIETGYANLTNFGDFRPFTMLILSKDKIIIRHGQSTMFGQTIPLLDFQIDSTHPQFEDLYGDFKSKLVL